MKEITLATSTGDDAKMAMRYAWHRMPHALSRDCAVAHALIDAIEGVLGKTAKADVYDVAREILREQFGIEA